MHKTMCGGLDPDLTLLLLANFDKSLARARRRNDRTANTQGDEARFERENEEFHRRVYDKYREIASREPGRVLVIDGDRPIEAIHREITAIIEKRFRAAGLISIETTAPVR
jgi:dTMP kinase